MTEKEMLEQLEDLIVDRKSFISSDSEMNEMFIKDIVALELIISKYKELKLNDTVEILEEEKKILEKLPIGLKQTKDGIFNTIVKDDIQYELNEKEEIICKKINEIVDYLDYLKSKGE